MTKLIIACFLATAAISMSTQAFILEGKEVSVPEGVVQYCATADNYWVCVQNKMSFEGDDSM